jgi:predicted nucleotidyltransferase
MLEKYNRYKLLKIFLFNPTDSFRLRELSRLSKISPPSVMEYLKEFEKEELIKTYVKRDIPFYKSNLDSEKMKSYKKLAILFELENTGLINFLNDKFAPEAIILYGSYSKGEFTEESDIDIFLLGVDIAKTKIDIEEYERKLGKTIHLMGEKTLNEVSSKEFKNNLINGIILRGYLKIL